jgi:uncharacterized Zn-binding protein involved in type VI secretion
MPPQTRIGDPHSGHACWPPTPMATGAGTVFVNNIPAVRVTDIIVPHSCPPPPHTAPVAVGSGTVYIEGPAAARIGDPIACGGVIIVGSPNVITGG